MDEGVGIHHRALVKEVVDAIDHFVKFDCMALACRQMLLLRDSL
jgi:hypothetical protein